MTNIQSRLEAGAPFWSRLFRSDELDAGKTVSARYAKPHGADATLLEMRN